MITLDHVIKTERETLKFRLLALVIVGLGLYFRKDVFDIGPIVFLLLSYFIYAMTLGPFVIPRISRVQIIYGMILVDALVVNAGLYLAGGVRSYIFVLLPLMVIYYSMFFGYVSSLFSATLFSSGYVVTAWLKGDYLSQGPYIALQVIFLYMAALLSGYLSRRRLQEMKEKVELQEALLLESQAKNLLEVARRMSSSKEEGAILSEIVKDITRFFKVSGCIIYLYDKEKKNLVARASSLAPGKMAVSRLEELAIPVSKNNDVEDIFGKGKPLVLTGMEEDKVQFPFWVKEIGDRGLLILPLKKEKEKIGLIFLFDELNPEKINESQLPLAESYIDIVSRVLADSLLYQESQQKIEQMTEALKNAIRRLERTREPAGKREMVTGGLYLNGPRGIASYNNKPLELSTTEFELLYLLAENSGHPVNHETLLRRVWGENVGQANVVDVAVHRLRRKLEGSGAEGIILTIRGIGYMLVAKEERLASQNRSS